MSKHSDASNLAGIEKSRFGAGWPIQAVFGLSGNDGRELILMDRQQIERISKALGDQTRLMIYESIASCDEMNCGQIVSLQGVTPATVSHHLKALADAGLIETRREGQFVYNKAVPATMEDYLRSLAGLIGKNNAKKESGKIALNGITLPRPT